MIKQQRYFEKRVRTIVSGGLIAISVVILQTLISADKLDRYETNSLIFLVLAIPMLAGCFIYYSWLMDDYHLEGNKIITILFNVGGSVANLGIFYMIYHVSIIAAYLFAFSVLVTIFLVMISLYGIKDVFKMLLHSPFLLFSSKYRQRIRRGEIL